MATISTKPFTPTPFNPPAVLPLEDGDHMTAEELICRWEALPEEWREKHKRVELINGVVRMSPIGGSYHAEPHFNFMTFLGVYSWATPGVLGFAPASIILDPRQMPEPDASLAIDPKYGGRVKMNEKGYVIGAPELVVEVSSSSVKDDLSTKKELYRKFDVREYVVWRVNEPAIDWFKRQGDEFEPLLPIDGIYKSESFPGLWLAAAALIAGDFAQVNAVLQKGLASPEHRDFVARLQNTTPVE